MTSGPVRTDWVEWHAPYADPDSSLSRRRRVVQGHVAHWLDRLPTTDVPPRILSACAGDGRDVLDVLAQRPRDAARLDVLLVELDDRLAGAAASYAGTLGLDGVEVRTEDAGSTTAYRGHTPAGLMLLCGVFGNVAPDDVPRTVAELPRLCARGATVVWTRGRADGRLDAAHEVRDAFASAGHRELAFTAPDDAGFTVGAHLVSGQPADYRPDRPLFAFTR